MKDLYQSHTQEKNITEQSNYPQKYKKTNLFFIKSKHAFRQYKNHDYFEVQKEVVDKNIKHRSRQFVESPTPYGINNAYDYICEQISKNNIRKYNTTEKKFRTLQERYDDSHRKSQISQKQKRKTHFTLPNLDESKKELKQQLFGQRQANKQQTQYRQAIHGRNFTSTSQKTQYSQSLIDKRKKQYSINLIYVDVQQSVSRLHSFQLRLNILNYIINTFLKAKINYSDLTEDQVGFVINRILQIYEMERQYMEYKDLVNFKSTKEIFDFLSSLNGKETVTKQTLRYFFIAKKEVYEYQLNRLKDEIKDRLQFQFQNSGKDDIYIFEMHTGAQITNLYELIKYNSSKYIVGVDPNAWTIYRKFTQEQKNKRQLVQRVNNWKSIISDKTHTEMSFKPITVEKYQNLFDGAQRKRAKMNRTGKKCEISLKNSQFINRQALFKDQNIFQ